MSHRPSALYSVIRADFGRNDLRFCLNSSLEDLEVNPTSTNLMVTTKRFLEEHLTSTIQSIHTWLPRNALATMLVIIFLQLIHDS